MPACVLYVIAYMQLSYRYHMLFVQTSRGVLGMWQLLNSGLINLNSFQF